MKQILIIFAVFFCAAFSSCQKESADSNISGSQSKGSNQDKSDDVITGDDYTYTLPVIFHVLYQNADDTLQYIRTSRLQELINNVNTLYKANIWVEKFGKGVDINVNFELATEDENGNKLTTPGVEYIKYSGTFPIDCDEFMNDQSNTYTKYIWEPNDYINVMVYPFASKSDSETTTLGISIMPYKYDGYPNIEGLTEANRGNLTKANLKNAYCLSINSLYIYKQSSYYTSKGESNTVTLNTLDANITLAHELGHYLGLHHDFAEDNGKLTDSDIDSDYCTDTKSYNRVEYNNWLSSYIKTQKQNKDSLKLETMIERSNSKGESWNAINIMDYSVTMGYEFTSEQRNRIRQVLYYSPLIPGPKKSRSTTKSGKASEERVEGLIDLPIQLAK